MPRTARARAEPVQGARHQLFSGAAFTCDQDGSRSRRHLLDFGKHSPHDGGIPHQLAQHAMEAELTAESLRLLDKSMLRGGAY